MNVVWIGDGYLLSVGGGRESYHSALFDLSVQVCPRCSLNAKIPPLVGDSDSNLALIKQY